MNWLTRAELRRDGAALKALTHLLLEGGGDDRGHALVWTLFAHDPDAPRDFLFRESEPGRYLILSERPPVDAHGLWVLECKPYQPRFEAGLTLNFILRANPARSIKVEGKRRGARVDAVMHAKTLAGKPKPFLDVERAALDWLFERESRLGVRFERTLCSAEGYRQSRVARTGKAPIRFSTIDFEGILVVDDPDALARAVASGVGKARAYGCGLLALRAVGP